MSAELCGELNSEGFCAECDNKNQDWFNFKKQCNLFMTANHVRKRVYVISGLITILSTIVVGYYLFEFTRYELFWLNISSSANNYWNNIINYLAAFIIFVFYIHTISAIHILLLMLFANTTTDETNVLLEQDIGALRAAYIGELNHHDKALFLKTFQETQEFNLTPVKGYIERIRIRDRPFLLIWLNLVICSGFILSIFFTTIGIEHNMGTLSYIIAAITLLVLPLLDSIHHLVKSFVVVEYKVHEQYADELTSQFEHFLNQDNSCVD
jgi:hypothetical protein